MVEEQGMKAVAVPLKMSRDGLIEKIDKIVAIMSDPAMQPVYIHCRHGQDRTGIAVAAYRMKMQGWSLSEAQAEMQDFGFNNIWVNFKMFIKEYDAHLKRQTR
jgi:protein tyrosine/serine phosphatase